MILIIDNYDSFVFNLARYTAKIGLDYVVHRNDAIRLDDIASMKPDAIILSPGPCAPAQAGISVDIIKTFGPHIPILGVCLGHQAIGEAYGGVTMRARQPVHGKASMIEHDGSGIFHNLPSPMPVGRYHSLITDIQNAQNLMTTALNEDDEIMAMRHKHDPVYGVQFHPESILTPHGQELIKNFILIAQDWITEHQDSA